MSRKKREKKKKEKNPQTTPMWHYKKSNQTSFMLTKKQQKNNNNNNITPSDWCWQLNFKKYVIITLLHKLKTCKEISLKICHYYLKVKKRKEKKDIQLNAKQTKKRRKEVKKTSLHHLRHCSAHFAYSSKYTKPVIYQWSFSWFPQQLNVAGSTCVHLSSLMLLVVHVYISAA